MEESKGNLARRGFEIVVSAILITSVTLVINTPQVSAAPDAWTEWSYDDFIDSFDYGFYHNVELNGQVGGDGNITIINEGEWGWYNMTPSNPPGQRDLFGFAFDSKNNVAVLFGGKVTDEGKKNDTWEYDFGNNTWTLIIPDGITGSPPRRSFCQMDYDSANNVIVLWGGTGESGTPLTDTWEFDVVTKTWNNTAPRPSPPFMGGYALAYDSKYHKILVAGTNESPPGGLLHLWAYDSATNTWTERSSTPYPRAGHDMDFDGEEMVLQGGGWGATGEIKYSDTLWYDYGTDSWRRVPSSPGYRTGHAMARISNVVFIVNGRSGRILPEDIWSCCWSDETPLGEPKPCRREKHRMVGDSYHDAMILYGGYGGYVNPPLIRLNDTWVYASGYAPQGYYVSRWNGEFYFDSRSVTTNWLRIWWNATSQPLGTKLKFQLSSGNVSDPGAPDPDRTYFVGPGNSRFTYYETPGQLITSEHRFHRYIRYKAIFQGHPANTPLFDDITITYDPEGPPFIERTDPADEETDVFLWKNITIEFNEPMDTGTVTWTIYPDPSPGSWTEVWTEGDTILTLKHPDLFTENLRYMVAVTSGKDLDGYDLIDAYDLNPWNFTATPIRPWLVYTNPANTEINVLLTETIIVKFSEPMINHTVEWTFSSYPVPAPSLTAEWANSNTTLHLSHTTPFVECQSYLIGIPQGKDLSGNSIDLRLGAPNPWRFYTYCDQPFVADRDPEHGTRNVPLGKNIVITFSEEMQTSTVSWYVAYDKDGPPLNLGWSWVWEMGNMVLNISHSIPFLEDTPYWVNVTYGEDLNGNELNRIMGLPRWYFVTGVDNPWIVSTDPYHEETGVPADKKIMITFSESINPVTFTYTISPDPGGWNWSWSLGNTVAAGTHNPFLCLTLYTLNITHAVDLDGNPLDPTKGAPNPWSFTTAVDPPHDLRVIRNPPDIIIQWDAVPDADEYRVYESQDRFALWSSWNSLGNVSPPITQYNHQNAHDDGLNHFYIVRSFKGDESVNSTMGVKAHLPFTKPIDPEQTDINWISLPYDSIYKKASDITKELTELKIRMVGKWSSERQRAITYAYVKGEWKGRDFDINPGDGILIAGLQTDFYWVINGTDSEIALEFIYYPAHNKNINWISVPYTGIYDRASSIVSDIEGDLFTPPAKIVEVGLWDPVSQTSITYYWDGTQWTGTDFPIEISDGIYIETISSFSWTIKLLTPTV